MIQRGQHNLDGVIINASNSLNRVINANYSINTTINMKNSRNPKIIAHNTTNLTINTANSSGTFIQIKGSLGNIIDLSNSNGSCVEIESSTAITIQTNNSSGTKITLNLTAETTIATNNSMGTVIEGNGNSNCTVKSMNSASTQVNMTNTVLEQNNRISNNQQNRQYQYGNLPRRVLPSGTSMLFGLSQSNSQEFGLQRGGNSSNRQIGNELMIEERNIQIPNINVRNIHENNQLDGVANREANSIIRNNEPIPDELVQQLRDQQNQS